MRRRCVQLRRRVRPLRLEDRAARSFLLFELFLSSAAGEEKNVSMMFIGKQVSKVILLPIHPDWRWWIHPTELAAACLFTPNVHKTDQHQHLNACSRLELTILIVLDGLEEDGVDERQNAEITTISESGISEDRQLLIQFTALEKKSAHWIFRVIKRRITLVEVNECEIHQMVDIGLYHQPPIQLRKPA